MKRIAIFASGSGTNAENIIRFFAESRQIVIDSLWSNNENAGALLRAEKLGIDALTFGKDEFYSGDVAEALADRKIDLVVLAGFLWLAPPSITCNFVTINIHPALLPKYGGKGMYGHHVHEAVLRNGDTESGITIHYVNDEYDSGDIIFQARCNVATDDTADSLAAKVHLLEYEHFPRIIADVLLNDAE
ncbi:MAG: phosphoribosylglycinamide formyltransferase [Bacteroidales bacterium]|jgi:phosphoribosylglycinamide formyltransferase-1|nr:phosphoribosylglycinamide formyltransferase [Bacteroidales bacterium]